HRPAGGPQGHTTAAERFRRAYEGHCAGQRHRSDRGRPGRARPLLGVLQPVRVHPRSLHVPDCHDPAGTVRRSADKAAGREIPERHSVSEVILNVTGLTKSYGKLDVLAGIDFDLKKGEVVCVIGPSGSGKSTLL